MQSPLTPPEQLLQGYTNAQVNEYVIQSTSIVQAFEAPVGAFIEIGEVGHIQHDFRFQFRDRLLEGKVPFGIFFLELVMQTGNGDTGEVIILEEDRKAA